MTLAAKTAPKPRLAPRLLKSGLRVIVVSYVGLGLVMCASQRKLIFPAGGTVDRTPENQGWAYEEIWFDVAGERTNAWFMPVDDARATILFSHGNAGTISGRLELCQAFRRLNCNVLMYDYGGYGLSTGKSSEQRCYGDIRAAWDYLTETQGIAADSIIIYGRSLGGGPTMELACQVVPGAVVMESAFLSTMRVGRDLMPFLPTSLILRHRFDNASKIGEVNVPILVIHGEADEIIPFYHGENLYKLANEPKTFLKIKGGHNDGHFFSEKEVEEALGVLIDETLPEVG
jgi:fermentation-respiration switch protein FrsA (DUF1100 family)